MSINFLSTLDLFLDLFPNQNYRVFLSLVSDLPIICQIIFLGLFVDSHISKVASAPRMNSCELGSLRMFLPVYISMYIPKI